MTDNPTCKRCEVLEGANAELVEAAYLKILKDKGCKDAAFVFKKLAEDPVGVGPQLAQGLRRSSRKRKQQPVISNRAALSAVLSVPLTARGYSKLKKISDSNGSKFLPDWSIMNREKEAILPTSVKESYLSVTSQCAVMPLPSVLDLTLDRLLQVQSVKDRIETLKTEHGSLKLKFLFKIGCDGTTGLGQYNQNSTDGEVMEDSRLFGTKDRKSVV